MTGQQTLCCRAPALGWESRATVVSKRAGSFGQQIATDFNKLDWTAFRIAGHTVTDHLDPETAIRLSSAALEEPLSSRHNRQASALPLKTRNLHGAPDEGQAPSWSLALYMSAGVLAALYPGSSCDGCRLWK